MEKKILIIKLGAKGDAIRTLSILPALKQKHPDAKIYWLTKSNIADLMEGNPLIDKLLTIPYETNEKFEALYNFDIEKEATQPAMEIQADKKFGFYSEGEYASAFNLGAEYYLNTLFDDETKIANRKTYQEMMFEAAELSFKGEHVPIYLSKKDLDYAEKFKEENNITESKLIGIHMGAGTRWPSKAWSESKVKEFIKKAKQKEYGIILFGGPDEVEKQQKLIDELKNSNIKVYKNNPKNTNREFAALINLCDRIVCSDSFALHIALALKKKTTALFFCTPSHEIEKYGLLTALVSPRLYDFFPQKMDQFDKNLVNSISTNEVIDAL